MAVRGLCFLAVMLAAVAPVRAFVYDSFGDGFWNVVNQNNGKALVVSGTGASQAAVAAGDFGQQFELLLNLEDGTFRVRNRDSLKCIGALGTTAGSAVAEITYTGATAQRWNFTDAGGGWYQIVNVAANLALQTDGTNVTLQALSAGNLQRWQFNYQTHYPKKGGAGWDDKWAQFNVSWGYNWGANTGAYLPDDRVYEPMKYSRYWPGTGELGGGYGAMHSTPKPVYIMGFNEPDQASQGNTPVVDAIALWPELQNQNVPLVSPAATNAYNGWLGDFYNQIASRGYRVDFTAVHWYANPSVDGLINHLQSIYNTWGRPIWLTEFGNVDWAGNQAWSEEDDWRFLAEFMWRAEDLLWLKRYSMFVFNADPPANPWSNSPGTRSNMLKGDNTTLTAIGELYSAWDADRSLHPRMAYLIQGQNSMHRLSSSPANSAFPAALPYPSPVSIRISGAQAQWTFVQSPTAGQFYMISLLDGRRLRTDGNGVDLAPFGTTGTGVQWNISPPDAYGYFYIDNPTFGKALYNQRWNNGDGSPNSIYYGVTPSGNPQDITRFRYLKPVAAVTVPGAPAAPASVVATPGDRNVALSWTGTGFSYTVSRSTVSGGPYTVLTSNVQTLDFTDNSALNGTTYYYTVSAKNILAEASADSAPMSATPLGSLNGGALLADYKFESGDAMDRSARGQDGAVNGGVTFATAGKVDSAAATFDGINGYIQIPAEVGTDFTIAFWMKTTSTGGAGAQWYNGSGLVDGEVGGAAADFGTALVGTKVAFGIGNPDTTIMSTSAVNDGAWHHVAVTRNSTSGAMQLYLDGALQAAATGPTGTRSAPTTLRIGSIQTGFGYYNGSLDEVRLYNYALAAADVAKLFRPGNYPAAIYKLEGNAQDASGNGNHGAVAGGIAYTTGKVDAQAGQFNGTGNSVLIPSSLVNDFSIAYWIKTTATGAAGQWWSGLGIVDGEVSGAVNDFGTSLLGNKAAFGVGNADTTISSTTAINDGAWHHVTATRTGTTGAMNLYVDGALQATATGPAGPRTAPPALRIGGMQAGYGYFPGSLDDVRLYPYAMTPGQALALASPAPAPWVDTDIGGPAADGYAGRSASGAWTVGGSGADIWGTSDQFNFVNQMLTGDGSIVTRVTALAANADGSATASAKAGIMFRASTAAGAAFLDLVRPRGGGIQFMNRASAGAAAVQPFATVASGITAPFWLRLTRGGNVFQASYTTVASPAAGDWIFVGSTTVALPASALAGLVVSSRNDGTINEAGFDNLQLNANAAPAIAAVANQTISENTATATLPVTVGDLETPAATLTVTALSSNPTLAPVANIALGGSGVNRTVLVTPAANQSGTATITLTVNDGQTTTSGAFNVIVQTTPAGSWRQQWFGSTAGTGNADDNADPDKDGLTNLWERALNGNPNISDPAPLAQPGLVSGRLALTFTRSTAATDLTLTVQAADTLAGPWTDLASSTSGAAFTVLAAGATATETGTGATRAVQVRDLYLTTDPAHPGRFLRVQVQH